MSLHSTLHSIHPFHLHKHINHMASPQIKTGHSSDQFEFGCVTNTPGSPRSPADHLFSNGKLLPHVFPANNNISYSRSTSRASTISSSRDSFMSSRSNSTNSRNSTCSSARSSISEVIIDKNRFASRLAPDGNVPGRKSVEKGRKSNACQYQYVASQKWQFIAAAPVLRHQGSRTRKMEKSETLDQKGFKKKTSTGGEKPCFGRRILKTFLSACQECHAIKT